MKINKNNYEAFFLDFVEGRLDNSSTLEMLAFLRQNPDLKAELDEYIDIRIADSVEVFDDKNLLKKFNFNLEINSRNFDDYCIAYHEKLLSTGEKEKLLVYLDKHPDKKSDFQNYGKIYLEADENTVFEAKPFLKRKSKAGISRKVIFRWTAVAAGIALAITVFYKSPVKEKQSIKLTEDYRVAEDNRVKNHENQNIIKDDIIKEKIVRDIVTPKTVTNSTANNDQLTQHVDEHEVKESLNYIEPIEIATIESEVAEKRGDIYLPFDSVSEAAIIPEAPTITQYAGTTIKNIFQKKEKKEKKISLWDVAEVTLKGYNQISEKDIILYRETDEKGKLTAIAVETENRKYGFNTRN